MGLSGIEIFKQLPKTNCGDCGVPTCLAFAMKLAQGQAELASCPHVSEEATAALSEASAPPMRKVTVGTGEAAFTVGEETVLFRHDKTFVHPCAIGVAVSASESDETIDATVAAALAADFERVQQRLRCGFVSVVGSSDAARYAAVVSRIHAACDLPLVLQTDDVAELTAALDAVGDSKPLICGATTANADQVFALAKSKACPVVVRAEGLAAVMELTEKATAAGLTDIVIDSAPSSEGKAFRDRTFARRAALQKKVAALGYPVIAFPGAHAGGDELLETTYAAADVGSYASIIVLTGAEPWRMLPLLVLRQNLYTDPQRPMQAEAKIYPINNPGPDAPFFVTTNFSLTYFIVAGEIEGGKQPAYLGVVDAEGLSVLTAWAAGKFVPERIAKFVKDSGMAGTLSHREIIIPGAVAQISGELAEELDGWNVVVGPYEASDIPAFLRRRAG
ncbi:MAG: acetyl-CoA decarbonylase/synthase complex subunit gamma [Actinobacteria bacterium HGW-Actinobacteria-7]|jgi:acetyl-CoA decarbonylase/synthase complex subunit gamma|nr:MAG: acetyl-CoA decarbonylase/synthase complex subunit gamma [Actinobacteria bacterium HGW-Actinobacteria-7]